MVALIAWIYRVGLRRGLRGGNPAWFVVALAALILRRDQERRKASAITIPLKPGEDVIVSMARRNTRADS